MSSAIPMCRPVHSRTISHTAQSRCFWFGICIPRLPRTISTAGESEELRAWRDQTIGYSFTTNALPGRTGDRRVGTCSRHDRTLEPQGTRVGFHEYTNKHKAHKIQQIRTMLLQTNKHFAFPAASMILSILVPTPTRDTREWFTQP
jgi:hypothetical protein